MDRFARVLLGLALLWLAACGEREPTAEAPERAAVDGGVCLDEDGDGYGRGCAAGADCDDHDVSIHSGCLNCAQHEEACACAAGSEPEPCYLPPERHEDGEFTCQEGTRYCREGTWSACEELFSYPLPAERRAAALIDVDAGPITCNACNPVCFRVSDNLDPVDGGLPSSSNNQVTWNPGGGLTLAENPDAGSVTTGPDPNPPACVRGVAPDVDCDGIPDMYDPYPNDPPFATANPAIFLDIAPGETGVGQIDLAFNLNSADVYFLVDQSASMSDERDQLKSDLVSGDFINNAAYDCADYDFDGTPNNELKAGGIIGAIRCIIRDSNFGVGFFREIPFSNYAPDNQIVFGNHQDITADVAAVEQGVAALNTIGNRDWPEASMVALHNLVTGGGMYFGINKPGIAPRLDCPGSRWGYPCFRENAIPIVMLFTDAMMHNGPSNNDYAYNSNYLGISAGTDGQYVPVSSTNDTFGNPYAALDLTDRLVTYTGNTIAMNPDISQVELSCLSNDQGPDAIYSFSLSQQRQVLLSTEGSRFDTVLGLFAGQPQTPVTLPASDNSNETVATAQSLGQVNAGSVNISGNTSTMVADYAGTALGCGAATGAPDAVYALSVGSDANVALRTDGSTTDTVIALYDTPPPLLPSYTPHPDNSNNGFDTLTALGDVYGGVQAMSGDSAAAGLTSSFAGVDVGCGADDAANDVVYSFDLSAPTRVQISTEGSSYDTVIGLVGDTCSGSASSAVAPLASIDGGGQGTASSGTVQAFLAGSYVIPMDLTYQDDGMFEAYGLVYQLLRQNVPVSWIINKGKVQDGVDMTLSATDLVSGAAISAYGYRGGPFVIDVADVPAAQSLVTGYLSAHPQMHVHVAAEDFSASVGRQLVAAPRVALLDDGNLGLLREALQAASIVDSAGDGAWDSSSADVLSAAEIAGLDLVGTGDGALFDGDGTPDFCTLGSGHWTAAASAGLTGSAAVAEVRDFLRSATHLYAQCESAVAFENNSNGGFLTTSSVVAGSNPAAVDAVNPGLDVAQAVGGFEFDGAGGYPSFSLLDPDGYRDTDAAILSAAGTSPAVSDVLVSGYLDGECSVLNDQCDPSGVLGYKRGRVTYVSGHDQGASVPVSSNPRSNVTRLFFNALFASPCAWDTAAPDVNVQLLGPTDTSSGLVTYTVSYSNDGRGIAHASTLAYAMPASASLVAVSGAGGLSGSTVLWDLENLEPGESGSVTVTVRYAAQGIHDNYAYMDHRQGLTARRAVSGLLSTDYGGNSSACTSLGFSEVVVPGSSESVSSALGLGQLKGRVYSLTGNTSSMGADHDNAFVGCGAADLSRDAVVQFDLSSPADVEITGAGTAFDHVLSLYGDTTGGGVFNVVSTNTGESTDAPQDLGSLSGRLVRVTSADTTGMTSDYDQTQMTCASQTAGSGDAVYRFSLDATTTVRIDTNGSSFDTVMSLHDAPIELPQGPTVLSLPSSAETPATAFSLPSTLSGNDFLLTGTTNSMQPDLAFNDWWGPYCHRASDNKGQDAVVRFTVTSAGNYEFDLDASFTSAVAVYPVPAAPIDVPRVDVSNTGRDLASAVDVGVMDDWWVKRSGRTQRDTSSNTSCGAAANADDVFYSFSLASNRTLFFSTAGSAIDSVLQVYKWNATHSSYSMVACDEDRGTVCSFWGCSYDNDAELTQNLDAGDYFVVVTAEGNREDGDYQLEIRDTSLPGNNLIDCDGGSKRNTFTQYLTPGDYYAVVKGYRSSDNGAFSLSMRDSAGSSASGNNHIVACDDDGGTGQASAIEQTLPAGDYYVVVSGYSRWDEGGYQLQLEDLGRAPAGTAVACDDSVSGGESRIATTLDAGSYWLVVKGLGALDAGAFRVNIRDTASRSGVVLACDNDGGDGGSSVIERDLPAGRYFVVVKGDGASDEGAYKLSVRDLSNTGVAPLACDADSGPGESSYIQTRLLAGRTYYAVVKGDAPTDAGAYTLTVEDVDSNPIGAMACNDDGGSYKTSKIQQTLNPGTYYVAVKGYNGGAKGEYQLTMGGGASAPDKYVPPTWPETLGALQGKGVKVIPILSCHDDTSHGDGGDCDRTRSQARALATGTDTLGSSLSPLVFDIDRDGTGLSRNVVDGIASLASYLEMDVKVVIAFDPDSNPGFNVTVEAIDEPGDGCSGTAGGIEHLRCVPGATPKFNVSFENPLSAPVPLNPSDPNGGYNFRAQLIADDSFLIDEVPIYIIPEERAPNPEDPVYYGSGEYWQDVSSSGCTGNQRPDWRDLGWNASVPSGTEIEFWACTAEDPTLLDMCTPSRVVTVEGGPACTDDSDCALGFCDGATGACQVITGGACVGDTDCPTGGTCVNNFCNLSSQPAYIGRDLGLSNFQSYLRMKVVLTGSPPISNPPVLHNWDLTYLCATAD